MHLYRELYSYNTMLIILNGCLIQSSELKSTYLTSTIGSQYSDCSELAYMLQLYLELAYGVLLQ